MQRNLAGQKLTFAFIKASDGESLVVSGTPTGTISKDGGTAAAVSAVPVVQGNHWTWSPTQAETDADHLNVIFLNAGAVPVSFSIYTTAKPVTEQQVRDAMKLAPTGGAPAAGSVDQHLDDIQAKTDGLNFTGANVDANAQVVSDKTNYTLTSGAEDSIAAKVWTILTSTLTLAGSIGKLIVDNLNAAVSSRATQTSQDTQTAQINTIEGKTSSLNFTGAEVDANVKQWQSVAIPATNMIEDAGGARWTAKALETAPTGGGGTGLSNLGTGTAQAGTASTITLAASASGINDNYINGVRVLITSGQGSGQSRAITAYNGTTKVATVAPNWTVTPNATSTYELQGASAHVEGGGAGLTQQQVRDSMKLAPTAGAPAIGSVDLHLDDIQGKTDQLPADPASNTQVNTRSSHTPADVDTTLTGSHGSGSWQSADVSSLALEATAQAIKAKTDPLPASPANEVTSAAIQAKTDGLNFTGTDVDSHVKASSMHSVSYPDGTIYIDTVRGSAGTTTTGANPNGTASNPSSNLADALAIATATGLRRLWLSGDSNIALTAAATALEFRGEGLSKLDLAGQVVNHCHFERVQIEGGTDPTPGSPPIFDDCSIVGSLTRIGGVFLNCSFDKTPNVLLTGELLLDRCGSIRTGNVTLDGNVAGLSLVINDYTGDLVLTGLQATAVVYLHGLSGKLTLDASCNAAAQVFVSGVAELDNQSGITVQDGARLDQAALEAPFSVTPRAEGTAVPATNASLVDKIRFIALRAEAEVDQTNTLQRQKNRAGTPVAQALVSSDGVTTTRGSFT